MDRDFRRDRIGIYVVDVTLLVRAERRDHRHVSVFEQQAQQSHVDLDYIADVAKVDRLHFAGLLIEHLLDLAPPGVNDVSVNARQPNRLATEAAQRRDYVQVDLPGKDHLGDLERLCISNPSAVDDALSDAQPLGDRSELFAAAVNDSQVDAYLLTEGYLFGKRVELLLIFGDLSRELDDEDVVLETLNVRQRFTE